MFTTPTKWSVQTMRAAQFDGIRGRVQVREMQVPEIDEEDALVRVVTCGICRSDWHLWNGDWEWFGAKLLQPAALVHCFTYIRSAVEAPRAQWQGATRERS